MGEGLATEEDLGGAGEGGGGGEDELPLFACGGGWLSLPPG